MANDLLRCKSNYRKQILYILLTIVVSLIFAVILSWLGYYSEIYIKYLLNLI